MTDDAADCLGELVGHLTHHGLALRLGGEPGVGRLLFELPGTDQVVLEHLNRCSHRTDLVAVGLVGHLHVGFAVCQDRHDASHHLDRSGNPHQAEDRRSQG